MAGQQVVISVVSDIANFSKGFDEAATRASKLADGFKVAGVAIGALAVGVGAFLVSSIKAGADAEKVAAQTTAVIKSTGEAAGRSADQVSKYATQLSRMTGIDDEVIQSGENVLLTFTNIRGANFDRATAAALDLSQALGQDLQTSAIQLGKALNDPIKGISALQRVGVTFSETQQRQIDNYIKLGETAKAQEVILDEVNREFGGSAEAFGNTFEGVIGKVKVGFFNVREEIGSAFLPAFEKAGNIIAGILDRISDSPKFNKFIDGLSSRITNALNPLSQLLDSASSSDDPFKTFVDGLTKAVPLLGFIKQIVDGLGPELPAIEKGFSEIGSALGTGLAKYGPQIGAAFGQIVTAIVPLVPQILTLIPPLLQLVPPILQLVTELLPPLVQLLGTLLPPTITGLTAVIQFLLPYLVDFIQFTNGEYQAVGLLFNLLSGNTTIAQFGAQAGAIPGPVGAATRALQSFGQAIGTAIFYVNNAIYGVRITLESYVSQVVAFFTGLPGQIVGAIGNAGALLVSTGEQIVNGLVKGLNNASGRVGSTIKNVITSGIDIAKATLGIKSPSRVFAAIGGFTIAGLEQGLSASNNIASIMRGVSGDVISGYAANLDAPAGYAVAGAGAPVNVNVTFTGLVSDQVGTGRQVVAAVKDYYRAGGTKL